MEPESQEVGSLLDDLKTLTGQDNNSMESKDDNSDVKDLLKESLFNIQNQVHDHVLEYITRFQMSNVSSEQ